MRRCNSRGELSACHNWHHLGTDRGAGAGCAPRQLCRTPVSHHSSCLLSNRGGTRQTIRKFRRRSEMCQANDFAETISWQFHRFAQCELKLVRERPLCVVWHRVGFNHPLGSFCVDNEEWRSGQIPKVIEDDLLLFRIVQVQTPHNDAVNCRRSALWHWYPSPG